MATKQELAEQLDEDIEPSDFTHKELQDKVRNKDEEEQDEEDTEKNKSEASLAYEMNRNVKHNGRFYEKGKKYNFDSQTKKHFIQKGWLKM